MLKSCAKSFKDSFSEFRNLSTIAICGMLGALSIVLGFVGSISIGPYIKIGISTLPNILVDLFFGPGVGMCFAGAMNLIKFFIKPDGAFFFGFTLSAMVAAVIYGLLLYQRKFTLGRFALSQLLVKLIVNVGMNTLWLTMMYGKLFTAILPARLISNMIQLPVDVAVYFLLIKALYPVLMPRLRSMNATRSAMGQRAK